MNYLIHFFIKKGHNQPERVIIHIQPHIAYSAYGQNFGRSSAYESGVCLLSLMSWNSFFAYGDSHLLAKLNYLLASYTQENTFCRTGIHDAVFDEEDI